jgi:hypothetical protein
VKPEEGTEASSPLYRIGDAFAFFCKKPVGTSVEDLIGQSAILAIERSAQASVKRKWFRYAVYTVGGLLIAGSLMQSAFVAPSNIAMVFAIIGVVICGATRRDEQRTEEPTLRALTAGASADDVRHIQLLEEYRSLLASGKIKLSQRRPDGSWKDFDADLRASFAADHGRLVLISVES